MASYSRQPFPAPPARSEPVRAGGKAHQAWMDSGALRSGALLLALLAALMLGVYQLALPQVIPSAAPAHLFSGERAMLNLRTFAVGPRASGTPGHGEARQYLLQQLTAMGLEPEVQHATGVVRFPGSDTFAAGTVYNIIARLPGTASTGAIALNAHYDSGRTGPGAADCGSCVVTVLETLRAVQAGPAMRNDLIIVFSDAEEEQDLGSNAFNWQHPWAEEVRLALNFEAQGSGGPALLYATSPDNGWLVSQYLSVAPYAASGGILAALMEPLATIRGACDLQDYIDRGSAGLGFLFGADTPAYHTIRDNVDVVDPRTIQQQGANALAAVNHFGNLDLTAPPRATDRVFFDILPGVAVHYPESWAVPLATLATALVAALLVLGFRRAKLTGKGLAGAMLLFVMGTLGSVVLTTLLWMAVRALNDDYTAFLIGTYQTGVYLVIFSAFALALVAGLHALFRRRIRPGTFAAGALLGWVLLILWPLSLGLPGASYLAIWPLLFALLPLAWTFLVGEQARHPWRWVALLGLAAAPGIVLMPSVLYQLMLLLNRLEGLMGLPMLALITIVVAPLSALLVPQFHLAAEAGAEPARRWALPAAAALVAATLLVWANLTSGFDATRPRTNYMAYELDSDTGAARWASPLRMQDRWTAQFLGDDATPATVQLSGMSMPGSTAPAPAVALVAPDVSLMEENISGMERALSLRLRSPRRAGAMSVLVEARGVIVSAAINGQPLDLEGYAPAQQGVLSLKYAGLPAEGFELTIQVRSAQPLSIMVRDRSDGLPGLPGMRITPRPPETMVAPGDFWDATVVSKTFTY